MTYPPHDPHDGDRPDGLGERADDAPDMRAPSHGPSMQPPPPTPRPEGQAWKPLAPQQPPPPPPVPKQRAPLTPWIWTAAIACVALLGIGVAVFAINGGEDIPPEQVAGDSKEQTCQPPKEAPQDPLQADEFYNSQQWNDPDESERSAELIGSWNHSDCCDVGLAGTQAELNEMGCVYGIESAYKSADGHMGIAQLILSFGDSNSALAASDIDFTSFKLKPDSGIYDDTAEQYGYIEPSGGYLIVTIGSVDSSNQEIVDDSLQTLNSFHYDHLAELPW